ncbi:hypothetical protein OU995_10415 [Roseateles sp. SL47]|uniref:hypothetical protein n=1 Tax=Roseateles sp. SL47 TaxID=2995138 RepID=UPI00226DD5C8|nr:hypothetical protein [Roseateles sp. SL47]WAC75077.1 hypothetical protein OU995_10415 [Roseateles sp. SL47]
MTIEPNPRTAAAAGVWAAIGGMSFETWHAAQTSLTPLTSNLMWGGFMLIFVLLPLYFLVIGRQAPFGRDWVKDPAERARYAVSVKRMLVWLGSGALVAVLWTVVSRHLAG